MWQLQSHYNPHGGTNFPYTVTIRPSWYDPLREDDHQLTDQQMLRLLAYIRAGCPSLTALIELAQHED